MTDFKETQRIPDNQPLACNCLNETGPHNIKPHFNIRALDLAHTCIRGYTVELNSILWAGLVPTGDSAPLYPDTISCPAVSPDDQPISNSLTEFIMEARMNDSSDSLMSDPVDVVLYEGGVHPGGRAPIMCFPGNNISQLVNYQPDGDFAMEFCTRGYCRGDVLTSWFLSDVDYPCMSDREGLLCGECRSGYALTTYSTVRPLHVHTLTLTSASPLPPSDMSRLQWCHTCRPHPAHPPPGPRAGCGCGSLQL